jgi:hypothetical protein
MPFPIKKGNYTHVKIDSALEGVEKNPKCTVYKDIFREHYLNTSMNIFYPYPDHLI